MDSLLSLAVPIQVAVITGGIGAITIILNTLLGREYLKILKHRRFIDTISTERIEWLNKIRDSFIEYSKLGTELQFMFKITNMNSSLESLSENNIIGTLI